MLLLEGRECRRIVCMQKVLQARWEDVPVQALACASPVRPARPTLCKYCARDYCSGPCAQHQCWLDRAPSAARKYVCACRRWLAASSGCARISMSGRTRGRREPLQGPTQSATSSHGQPPWLFESPSFRDREHRQVPAALEMRSTCCRACKITRLAGRLKPVARMQVVATTLRVPDR